MLAFSTFVDPILNPIFQHFWSSLLFFVIMDLIIYLCVNKIKRMIQKRKDDLLFERIERYRRGFD